MHAFLTTQAAIDDIRQQLGSRESFNVLQACNAIVRWTESASDGGTAFPTELMEILATLVTVRSHNRLALLISTYKDVLERLPLEQCASLFARISQALRDLLKESEYSADESQSPYSIGEKLRIRVACARLSHRLVQLGVSDPVLDGWLAAVTDDQFSDVRRERDR